MSLRPSKGALSAAPHDPRTHGPGSKLYRIVVSVLHSIRFYHRRNERYAGLIRAALEPLSTPRVVVDLGCGFGGLTSLLHPGNFLVGVDRDRSKLLPFVDPETPRVQAEAERLPFKDSSLDAVVAVSLLEHVADQASLLREVGRVLRPQGRVILQIPELRFPFEPHTKWPLLFAWKPSLQKRILQSTNYSDLNLATSPDKLRELALAAGFEMGEWIPIWHFAAARVLRMPMGYFSVLTKP